MDKKLERILMWYFPADFWMSLFLIFTLLGYEGWQTTFFLLSAIMNALGGFLDWLN